MGHSVSMSVGGSPTATLVQVVCRSCADRYPDASALYCGVHKPAARTNDTFGFGYTSGKEHYTVACFVARPGIKLNVSYCRLQS